MGLALRTIGLQSYRRDTQEVCSHHVVPMGVLRCGVREVGIRNRTFAW